MPRYILVCILLHNSVLSFFCLTRPLVPYGEISRFFLSSSFSNLLSSLSLFSLSFLFPHWPQRAAGTATCRENTDLNQVTTTGCYLLSYLLTYPSFSSSFSLSLSSPLVCMVFLSLFHEECILFFLTLSEPPLGLQACLRDCKRSHEVL